VAVSASLLPAALLLIAGLLSLISFALDMIVAAVVAVLGLVIDFKLLAKQMKSTNSLLNSLMVSGILTVVGLIIAWIVVSIILGYFESTFGFVIEDLMEEMMGSIF
jgi:flagellar biosynthesis protein FlhB